MIDQKKIADAFKALSNPNRLKIYLEILDARSKQVESSGSGCVLTDFIKKLNCGAPTVSHHIKALVNADLITVERNGKFMTCHLNDKMREELKIFFEI
jgi:ArsR family transcriptional regulator